MRLAFVLLCLLISGAISLQETQKQEQQQRKVKQNQGQGKLKQTKQQREQQQAKKESRQENQQEKVVVQEQPQQVEHSWTYTTEFKAILGGVLGFWGGVGSMGTLFLFVLLTQRYCCRRRGDKEEQGL